MVRSQDVQDSAASPAASRFVRGEEHRVVALDSEQMGDLVVDGGPAKHLSNVSPRSFYTSKISPR